MTGLDDILMETMLREDHAEAMTDDFSDIDTFIQDQITDDIIDTVIDDTDYEDNDDSSHGVDGTMFSIYDTVDYK